MSAAVLVIVEDDPDVGVLFDDVAKELGFETRRVQSASELIAVLEAENASLAIIDLGAVQSQGEAIVETLKEKGVRAIRTTGRPLYERPLWAFELDFLAKPFRLDELTAHIRGGW